MTPNSTIPRSASTASLSDAVSPVSTPNRMLARSVSTLNVSLELEHHQIVFPHTISSVLNDPTVRIAFLFIYRYRSRQFPVVIVYHPCLYLLANVTLDSHRCKSKHPVFVEPTINPSPLLVDAPLASYKPYLQQTHEVCRLFTDFIRYLTSSNGTRSNLFYFPNCNRIYTLL